MKSLPWFKFAPQAWRGDQSLRAVSIAARGLWIECLCIMHEAKPYGHLVLNGAPVGVDALARMTGVTVDEATELLSELRQAGVFSMTGKGVIFSRRMVHDFEKAKKGKKSAEKRWKQPVVKQEETDRPNGSPIPKPNAKSKEVRVKDKDAYQHPIDAAGKVDFNLLELELRKAAGLENSPSPKLFVVAPILGLLKSGHDMEMDILPTIRAVSAKSTSSISSWDYFTKPIQESLAKRRGIEAQGRLAPIAPAAGKSNIFEQMKGSGNERPEQARSIGPVIDAVHIPIGSGQGEPIDRRGLLDSDRGVHNRSASIGRS